MKTKKNTFKDVYAKIIIAFSVFVLVVGLIFYKTTPNTPTTTPIEEQSSNAIVDAKPIESPPESVPSAISVTKEPEPVSTEKLLPAKVLLSVPFIPQAPFGVWDALHEEACEEASLLTIFHFVKGEKNISKESIESEIQDMVAYEEENGYGPSITLEELNTIAKNHLDMKTGHLVTNATIDKIKAELIDGNPIIIPASGKTLKNPNFKNGGPVYHNLVIIGYENDIFITNDPGTRLGKGYEYSAQTILDSIHDWNPTNIFDGQKAYLVFK
jgi:hypothetical protein